MAAWTCRRAGAGTPVRPASSTTAPMIASISRGLPASRSCSIDVLWWPTRQAPSMRFATGPGASVSFFAGAAGAGAGGGGEGEGLVHHRGHERAGVVVLPHLGHGRP